VLAFLNAILRRRRLVVAHRNGCHDVSSDRPTRSI
jgi:hypothetical protein